MEPYTPPHEPSASVDDKPSPSTNGHCAPDLNGAHSLPLAKRPRHGVCLASEFAHHEAGVVRLNNGSFGSCPASVLRAQGEFQRLFLAQPDAFYFNTLQPALEKSRRALMPFIGLKESESSAEVALVDNATTAAAIVLQHMAWQFTEGTFHKGDVVLMLHYAYGAVKKSIHAYAARAGAHVIEVPLPFPLSSPDDIIREFRNSLQLGNSNGRRVRMAVIDHITSMPCVVVPVRELVQICREEGVDQVFVDGAHAIGNVEVDVEAIGADFYTSNLHKWFFCPPAVAFLHSCKGRSNSLHHPVVSHEYGNGLPMESGWIGTRDYSAQLVVPDAINFVNKFEGGIEGIRKRNHEKVVEMGRMLAQAWGTDLGAPPEMSGSMVMVGLPGCLGICSDSDAMKLRGLLREEYKVEVPIYYNSRRVEAGEEGPTRVTGYARISYQVYNVEAEYFVLRDAITKLVSNGFNCAMLS
ncbi:putative L-cysteine desulfhydrase 1 [Carex rostrata]